MSSTADKQIILITGTPFPFPYTLSSQLTPPGATAGIGLDTAILLSSTPTNHIILGARNPAKASTTVSSIQSKNPQASVSSIELDVDSDASISSAAKKLEQDFGRIDVLVNNAGICPEDPSGRETTRENLRKTFETNVFGPTILTQALLPLLQAGAKSGGGGAKVINVTSGLGSISMFDASLPSDSVLHHFKDVLGIGYRMSKSALNMLSAFQQYQYGKDGLKVWAYCPGYVATDLTGDREAREKMGLESSETSAVGVREIVEGERDGEVGGFVTKRGGVYPW